MAYKIITLDQMQMTVTLSLPDVEAPPDLVAKMAAQIERDIERAFYGEPKPSTATVAPAPIKRSKFGWLAPMDYMT